MHFTVRRMMVLVAAAAVAMGAGAECVRRRARFLSLAEAHAADACDGRTVPPQIRASMSPAEVDVYYEKRLAWEEYHGKLFSKYARAARCPWLPVEPDPPEPE